MLAPKTPSAMLQRAKNSRGNTSQDHPRSSPDATLQSGSAAGGGRHRRSKQKSSGLVKKPGLGVLCWVILISMLVLWLLYSLRSVKKAKSRRKHVGPKALAKLPPEMGTFEFRGTTRTAGKKPRIAIVTNAVAYPYGDKTTAQWSLFKEYFANKDCYAKTHGYDLIVDSRLDFQSKKYSMFVCILLTVDRPQRALLD